MTQEEVFDIIYSIKNRCEALELLHQHCPKVVLIDHLMHTLIEDMFVDIQTITDGFCVVRE